MLFSWCWLGGILGFEGLDNREQGTGNSKSKGKGGGFEGERVEGCGGAGFVGVPSRSKDALRMTARTNNGKNKQRPRPIRRFWLRQNDELAQATARATTTATARANAGILRCAQNDNSWGLRSE